ncbi:APC family permease [Nocardia pseudovaccinii]|uniref:APC family permease n=1 Tax=Nocardia pseudovaccinii TaxID=189540 RepID=UPI003D91372E
MIDPVVTESGELVIEESSGLRGNVGTFHLFFTTLSYNAPLAISVGFIPAVIAFGNGVGAPVTVLVVGILTALFANGFVAMAQRIPRPGGFYAYITASLGRPIGLSAGFLAFVGYLMAAVSSLTFGGISVRALMHDTFGGPKIDWWVLSGILALAVGVVGYFKLDISAKVLTVLLSLEIILVMAYNVAVIVKGGAHGLEASSFTLHAVTSGSLGLTLLYGILLFTGYEATVIFRDEARNPKVTIPRATYGFIFFVTVLYAIGAWVFIQGVGADNVVEETASDPTGTFLGSIGQYLGKTALDLTTLLLCTSIFAAVLAAHNVSSRYLFNLSADRIFPRWFGVAHSRLQSPHRASLAITAISFLGLFVIAISVSDSATLYARLAGGASYVFLLLMGAAAIGAARFLIAYPEPLGVKMKHIVAIVIAAVGYIACVVFATMNFDLLLNSSKALSYVVVLAIWGVALCGVLLGVIYRKFRPEVYLRIGRQ